VLLENRGIGVALWIKTDGSPPFLQPVLDTRQSCAPHIPVPSPLPSAMVQLSFAVGIIIASTALFVDFVAALSIKSKTASGNGCPAEPWVITTVVLPNADSNYTYINILYPDLGPEVTVEQGTAFGVKSCQVMLELDELPVGQQIATTFTDKHARFYADGADWIYRFLSEIRYGDGPIAVVRCHLLLCSPTDR